MSGDKIQGFKDLKAMDLGVRIHEITSTSAEGKSRFSVNESRQFVSIARGSMGELAVRLKYPTADITSSVEGEIGEIARMARGLERSLA
jgi:four helix bundle protein